MSGGSLQAKIKPEYERWYSSNRDLAHNYPTILELTIDRLCDRQWPELADFLSVHGVTDDDLGRVCQAYCEYVLSIRDRPQATLEELLQASGFLRQPLVAQMAFLAMMSTVVTGIHFRGVKEATIDGHGPMIALSELADYARRASEFIGTSPWRRKLKLLRQRLSRAIGVFKGNGG